VRRLPSVAGRHGGIRADAVGLQDGRPQSPCTRVLVGIGVRQPRRPGRALAWSSRGRQAGCRPPVDQLAQYGVPHEPHQRRQRAEAALGPAQVDRDRLVRGVELWFLPPALGVQVAPSASLDALQPGRMLDDRSGVDDPDDRFFRGESHELAPFKLPVATLHDEPGQFPWWRLDAGHRLVRFAHRFGSYDWSSDPRQPEQARLLRTLDVGEPDGPVDGDDEFLWHSLFAVVRADRFNDGLVAEHALALTRIANELRRRLLRQRAGT
jgi:hypothetical protein